MHAVGSVYKVMDQKGTTAGAVTSVSLVRGNSRETFTQLSFYFSYGPRLPGW